MTKPAISANSHITETPTLYIDNIDPKSRDMAPRVIDDQDKGQNCVIDGMRDTIPMSLATAAGKDPSTLSTRDVNFEELHRGGWDLKARLADQDRDAVKPLLKSGATVLGLSDAGAHASQLFDACLPTYFLGRWAREKQSCTVGEAVRMLTSRPADIVVFDPETVGAGKLERLYDFPVGADRLIARVQGIRAVVVNGTSLRDNGDEVISPYGKLSGSVLRNGHAAA